MKACCLSAARKTPGGFGFHRQCSRMGEPDVEEASAFRKGRQRAREKLHLKSGGELQLSVWGSCSPLTLPGWAESPLTKAIIPRSDGAWRTSVSQVKRWKHKRSANTPFMWRSNLETWILCASTKIDALPESC